MDINSLYEEIFDENGNIKNCGRDKCKELIRLLSDKYPDKDFGNKETGFMNVDAIRTALKK